MLEATEVQVPAQSRGINRISLAEALRQAQLEVWQAALDHGGIAAQVALARLRGVESRTDWTINDVVESIRDTDDDCTLPSAETIVLAIVDESW